MRHFFVLTALACFASSAIAEEEKSPDWNTQTLTGDWGGMRSNLYNKGIDLGFTHKSDVMDNTSGGIKRGAAWMGHTEARMKMDMEKLLGWDATSAYIHYHSQLGSKFNRDYIGSFIGVDNIETSVNTAQFYHAWVQKNFSGDSLSVLAGLYPIDSEFSVTDSSSVFIQPPYGMSNDVAQPVINSLQAPPIFPVVALALRVKYTPPSKNFYLQGAVMDGVPGDPNNQRGTHVQLNKGDGTLSIVEFGYTPRRNKESESFNKTAIGFWRYSAHVDDPIDVNVRRINQGAYFLAERTLMVKRDHPSQGMSGFIRFGTASRNIHQADWTGSLGLHYHGLIDGRDDDIAGIAVTLNHTSDTYRLINSSDSSQTNVEATYRAQVYPWLTLQPTVQYISNPNMDPTLQDAWVAGIRTEINF